VKASGPTGYDISTIANSLLPALPTMKSLPRPLNVICLLAGSAAAATATPPSHQAEFVVAPEVVIAHKAGRSFIGPG
jgi:hypothetical protein